MQPLEIGSLVRMIVLEDPHMGLGIIVSWKYLTYDWSDKDAPPSLVYRVYWSRLDKIKSHFSYELEEA